jgi:hypothetical protein
VERWWNGNLPARDRWSAWSSRHTQVRLSAPTNGHEGDSTFTNSCSRSVAPSCSSNVAADTGHPQKGKRRDAFTAKHSALGQQAGSLTRAWQAIPLTRNTPSLPHTSTVAAPLRVFGPFRRTTPSITTTSWYQPRTTRSSANFRCGSSTAERGLAVSVSDRRHLKTACSCPPFGNNCSSKMMGVCGHRGVARALRPVVEISVRDRVSMAGRRDGTPVQKPSASPAALASCRCRFTSVQTRMSWIRRRVSGKLFRVADSSALHCSKAANWAA